jgi:cell division protein FtsW (lipid II flippase)
VGEELGFLGVLVALSLFGWPCLCCASLGEPPTLSSLCVFGVAGCSSRTFENVGMTVNLMPITGIPPFFTDRLARVLDRRRYCVAVAGVASIRIW